MASGTLTFNYSGRTDSTTPYVHRTVMCQSTHRAKEIARSVFGCDPDSPRMSAVVVDENGARTTTAMDKGAALLVRG